jgi:hypothetical protein
MATGANGSSPPAADRIRNGSPAAGRSTTWIRVPADGAPPGPPQVLFAAVPPVVAEPYTSVYDVAPDGSRFLFRVPVEDPRTLPLRVRLGSFPAADLQ